MTELLTQEQLEKEMVDGGRSRMAAMMQRNEGQGGATNNPYASAVFRRYVLPMAAMIEDDMVAKRPGPRQAHVALLKQMDPQVVAYLATRTVLNSLMEMVDLPARSVILNVGKAVYSELLLRVFEEVEPDLFYTLVNDLDKRMSKNERYRMTIFKMQAKKAGIEFPEWGLNGVTQVGAYLISVLAECGMVHTYRTRGTKRGKQVRDQQHCVLTEEAVEIISQIKDFVIASCPLVLPCVERPKDWIGVADGGWHTNAMRRNQPFAIKTEGSWSELSEYDLSTPLAAINALQGVEWQINRRMLGVIKEITRYYDTGEIVSFKEHPKPERPYWLNEGMKPEEMDDDERDEFRDWKRQTAKWHTEQKIRGTKYGRFSQALRVAEKFAPYDRIWFCYFADFRGRLYAQSTGVSPQGSDLQKALIHFGVGKPLSSPEAVRWFKINGANKFGYDKASLDDRVAWVDEHDDQLRRIGADPINTKDFWNQADCPLQFLAWCLEYARWRDEPSTFKSKLPVGMDGSCNGLQNFSAMLRDEVGGKATNLVPSALPQDIYQRVADVTAQRLRDRGEQPIPEADGTDETEKVRSHFAAENRYRRMWLDHGINRSLVKRSVMTKPYGSTRFSCADFIVGDYLKAGKAPEFPKDEYAAAARYLSRFVWAAISEVVVKADEAMSWLQNASRLILKNHDHIRWVTPTGFPVIQRYEAVDSVRITSKLCGFTRLRIQRGLDKPDKHHHKNGIAPNFVHSMDGSHMALVALAGSREGFSLAMIHDDFGCHAEDAERFAKLIRETFVAMYENNDPLGDLARAYDLPDPPKIGQLDLRRVLESPYFFC